VRAVETRACEQCGVVFVPRREHARFCCVRCRAVWNREHTGDPAAGACALKWSVIAMTETIGRLPAVPWWDRSRAFAVIAEAVWQVTLVDATLVRHHLDTYDDILARQGPAQRRLTEQTLAGLRFVRNHIGPETSLAGFLQSGSPGACSERITGWSWKPVPEPGLASLAPHGREWELARYRAYQERLAERTIGQTFGRAAEFLDVAAAGALSVAMGARMPGGDSAVSGGTLRASVAAGACGPVVVLSGEADLVGAETLSKLITAQLSGGTRQLTVDVSALRFADTASIRTLVLAARTLKERGGSLILVHPPETMARVLDLLGARQIFTIQGAT
jgi:anti-anti-sigma factor